MEDAFTQALLSLQINWRDDVKPIVDSTAAYRDLLDFAIEQGFYATVVVSRPWFTAPPPSLLTHCEPILAIVESPIWPGTERPDSTAPVYWFRVTEKVKERMHSVGAFCRWICPDYPEDLCLWNTSLEWVVGSVAHEQMCFMNLRCTDAPSIQKIIDAAGRAEP